MSSEKVEEYLEAIYKLQSADRALGTSELGKELGVSAASATEMAKRLQDKGYVRRSKKTGITLSKSGERAALELIRKHRIAERFLVDVLGLDWQYAHEEACKFEHIMSPEVEKRMEALLDNPTTCPHGHPIPDKSGKTAAESVRRLSSLKRCQTGIIAKIAEERRDLLEYLATLGLMPQRKVRVEQIAPFDGPMLIQVDGANYALGREIADKIWVKGEK